MKYIAIIILSLFVAGCQGNNHQGKEGDKERREIPQRVVCMSSTHIAAMSKLGIDSLIVGVSGGEYITNKLILNGLSTGKIKDIGYESSLDFETLISLKPDILFTYDINGENSAVIEKIKRLGINTIVINDFHLNNPIERLESIREMGKIFNCSEKADSIIKSISNNYNSLTKLTAGLEKKKILLNTPWKGTWYIPGSENYFSKMVSDAGGVIVGSKDGEVKSHPYDTEEILIYSRECEIWILQNSITSIKELKSSNHLFEDFTPLIKCNVYNNTLRINKNGGNDYWETGAMEPDKILEDLIRIIHPEILEEGVFNYFERIY